jgi:hypothetical protein
MRTFSIKIEIARKEPAAKYAKNKRPGGAGALHSTADAFAVSGDRRTSAAASGTG